MKIEHITKLIIKFIGGGIVNFPTRFLKWIKVESCDCDGGGDDSGDDGGDDGGDSQDAVTSEDFNSFYISVLDNNYGETYNEGDTLQLSNIFEVPNINALKGLLTLGIDGETNPDTSMHFSNYQEDSESAEGGYEHSITLCPNGGESGHIQISTSHTFYDDGELRTYNYDIAFAYDGEDTLTVLYVNPPSA